MGFAAELVLTFIVFLVLTGIPILLTPVVPPARGESAAWGVVVPIGALTLNLLGLLACLLSTVQPNAVSIDDMR